MLKLDTSGFELIVNYNSSMAFISREVAAIFDCNWDKILQWHVKLTNEMSPNIANLRLNLWCGLLAQKSELINWTFIINTAHTHRHIIN